MEEVLECAATGKLKRLQILVSENPTLIDAIGPWTIRLKKSNNFIRDGLTPLIVAAAYGSLEIVSYILSFPNIDINRRIGSELTTALHSAASSRSPNAVVVVRLLLAAGADRNLVDSYGLKPSDYALANPHLGSDGQQEMTGLLRCGNDAINTLHLGSSTLDGFMMYYFKVHPCKIKFPHDWTDCTFFHPGEKARRRDPRMYRYSSELCLYFKAGFCNKGDKCKYAHGPFESLLHPSRYRTKRCADGGKCSKKICFFAHSGNELRVGFYTPFNPPMVHNVPTLHLPRRDMDSINWPSLSPRAMPPPNLDHGMNLHYVPGSNVAYGGSNLNLNPEVIGYRGHGMINQPAFGIDGHYDVVGGQTAELGDQFHNMEFGDGEDNVKTEQELIGNLLRSDPEWKS